MKKTVLISTLLLIVACFSGVNAQPQPVRNLLATKGLEYASVGISVVDIQTGKELVANNANLAMTPASVMKAVTTATALELFNPDFRFRTEVSISGEITSDGKLKGNLIIRGSGDPTLASVYSQHPKNAFESKILAALKTKGIKRIEGNIIGDESLYPEEGVSPQWLWEDLGNYFAAGIYGLNYGDNQYTLTLNTSQRGQQPIVKQVRPEIPDLVIDNQLLSKSANHDSCYIYGAPFSNVRTLYGAVPHKKMEFSVKGDVPEPALFAAQQVKSALEKNGIRITGEAVSGRLLKQNGKHIPQTQTDLCFHLSDPLSQIVKIVNFRSNNLYAEALMRLIAQKGGVPTARQGAETIGKFWTERGVEGAALFMRDGSGLSPMNKVTPSFLTRMLTQMHGNRVYVESLPRAGMEGTLVSFLKDTPYEGQVRLKSGTISGVIAYTGYICGKQGDYAIAVIVNNYTCKGTEVRKGIETLIRELDL